jgi:membrane protein
MRRMEGHAPNWLVRLGERVDAWFHTQVFAHDLERLPFGRRLRHHWLRVVYLSARGFVEDACVFRASALTYITVLSLVPLLAFSFALAKGLGFYRDLVERTIRPFLEHTFGSTEVHQAIDRVLEFVDRTDVKALGSAGLLFLLYTVYKLLSSIEQSFNHIWGAQRARSPVRKLTDYLAIVVVTPLLLFAATGITTGAQSTLAPPQAGGAPPQGTLLEIGFALAPLLSLWVAFTFVYMVMPNARTRWSSAMIGALVGGTLWQLTLLVQIQFQLGIARYNAIYSGFAALPLFLIWLQSSWVAVLLGAEVCFAHQSAASYYPDSPAGGSLRERERIALRALARIAARSLHGQPAASTAELASLLGVSLRPLELVLAELVEGGVLAVTRSKSGDTYLLARDIDRIQVKTVLDLFRGPLERASASDDEADKEVAACLVGLDEALGESRHNLPLRALAEHEHASAERHAARRG